jgi:hypothetical protein
MGDTMTYTTLQQRWLKHHYKRWQQQYGWSAAEFAKQVRQPPDALAAVLGVPLEEFGPPPAVTPEPPAVQAALPDPEHATVIIEPGVELMPREKAAAPPNLLRHHLRTRPTSCSLSDGT